MSGYPVPAGMRRRAGVTHGCGKPECHDCYERVDAAQDAVSDDELADISGADLIEWLASHHGDLWVQIRTAFLHGGEIMPPVGRHLKLRLRAEQSLYVRSMGKLLRVTAIFDDDDDANKHMARGDNNDAVVAVFGPLVLLADVYDKGLRVAGEAS